jgi:crotonobetainyl-CoA:carnitine CoA-transferase CaiB-like acyl-CoA transferase
MLQPVPHPEIPDLHLPVIPLWLDEERTPHRTPPPRVGEHTAEVLAEVGYSETEIAALAADGVIRTR